eukprot:4853165-Pleurochrysis_carterae.AAC.10
MAYALTDNHGDLKRHFYIPLAVTVVARSAGRVAGKLRGVAGGTAAKLALPGRPAAKGRRRRLTAVLPDGEQASSHTMLGSCALCGS